MVRYQSNEQKEKFKELCTLVDFKYEYPGYDGEIRYGFYSALPEHCLNAMFGNILSQITPYMKLDRDYVEARAVYRQNEKKFQYRNAVANQFSVDDDFEEHHPEVAAENCFDAIFRSCDYEILRTALKSLSEVQYRRVHKYFYSGMTVRQIAAEENVKHPAVIKSIQEALEKMKKFFT